MNYKRWIHKYLSWLKRHNPIIGVRSHVPDFASGLILSGILTFVLWAFAYFGYINLGLPSRFDFQILNKQITAALPKSYTYSTSNVNNFRGPGSQTVLVVGHSVQFEKENYKNKISSQNLSDIVLLFDKTTRGYKQSYKFKPVQSGSGANAQFQPLLTSAIYINHSLQNVQGKSEIILGWIYRGADESPPIPLIFSDNGGQVDVESIDPNRSPYAHGQNPLYITNLYAASQRLAVTEVDGYYANQSELAVREISNFVCKACEEQNSYRLYYFTTYLGKLSYEYLDPQVFDGLSAVNSYMNSKGYTSNN